ncbi:peptidoglycan recognition protein 5 [Nelusetta ayraudi]|uniref:peptidoglycan recognition protein 5 n=1 Tax=Nelusetta ayraudi TaxID=303726 RepID=UPI003F6ED3BA
MAQEVTIISREEWRAEPAKKKEPLKSIVQRVVIHHTDTRSSSNLEEGKNRVKSIQHYHMTEKEFDDIGYNFLIGGDGTVFEGRGWGLMGAHAFRNNHDSLGVSFLGNFNDSSPSAAAISSAKRLLQSGVSRGHISPGFTLLGHKDLGQTECPGKNLYSALAQIKG